jgi:CheY-like chemotaxis protein
MIGAKLPRVLIVEDDDVIREIYTLKLELEGFPVEAAENGAIALDRVDAFQPDIILLDMMMPVMGGLDFMRHWSAKGNKSTQIIVFSDISAPGQMSEVLGLGASEYWVKSDYTPELTANLLQERWQQQSQA